MTVLEPKASALGKSRQRSYRQRISVAGLFFVLPSVIFFAVFAIFPIAFGFYISLTEYNLISPPRFVGFDNYLGLLSDTLFQKSFWNTILFVIGAIVPVWVLSLALALLFEGKFRGNKYFRMLVFSPVLPPLVVVAVVWKLILHPAGPLTSLLGPLTGSIEINWLTTAAITPFVIVLVHDWTVIPLFMMIWLAGLAGVSPDLRDAAKVDGAGPYRTLISIILPILKPTSVLVGVLATINAFQAFILQFVLSPDHGGPADSTITLALLVWRYGFQYFRMGDAASVSFVIFAIILVIAALQLWLGKER